MSQIIFKNENDVSQDWLFYIENEAKALSQRDEFAINNYIDREAFNPDMKSFLASSAAELAPKNITEAEPLSLNFAQGIKANAMQTNLLFSFHGVKTKIKKIFCNVVRGIGDIDTKGIIKAVLLALIPVFVGGLPAIALPIIIGLIAYLIKYGIDRTCPI